MALPAPTFPVRGENLPTPHPVSKAFVARREQILRESGHDPLQKVASFLIYLSRDNVHHGGSGAIIGDDLRSGTIAWLLGMSVDALQAHLVALASLGTVACTASGGLQICDLAGLERVSDKGVREQD